MKYNLSDKIIAYLTLLSGLIISAVAVWYSVAGLVSIFAANALSIIIMGVALEGSKLVATVWLKWNWNRAPRLIKIYLISAIAVLMLITSMGIFGYLSKAHLDQGLVSGDVQSKISLVDEKIKIEKENIANAQEVIKQMDAAVTGVIATGDQTVTLRDGSTRVNSAAERSLQIRRSQAKDRAALTKQIEESQTRIVTLQEEVAPIRAEMRQVEAKVGPIKYIAALIYGDNPDANILEKAVTWVIIIIVLVFDPLAVVLLLASQYSFQWFRQAREEELLESNIPTTESKPNIIDDTSVSEQSTVVEQENILEQENIVESEISKKEDPHPIENNSEEYIEDIDQILAEVDADNDENHLNEPDHVRAAKAAWKLDYPNDSLKHQRRMLEQGLINELPWNLPPYTLSAIEDSNDNEAAVEAAKWAQEQIESSKKKVTTWLEKDGPVQMRKSNKD
jgi:hypothetical protein